VISARVRVLCGFQSYFVLLLFLLKFPREETISDNTIRGSESMDNVKAVSRGAPLPYFAPSPPLSIVLKLVCHQFASHEDHHRSKI